MNILINNSVLVYVTEAAEFKFCVDLARYLSEAQAFGHSCFVTALAHLCVCVCE